MKRGWEDWIKFYDTKELLLVSSQINWLEQQGDVVLPQLEDMFKAFELCPLDDLKVVIVGAEPYSYKGVSNGLAFGNKKEVAEISPSLKFLGDSVLKRAMGKNPKVDYTLESWAKQGVLLLNTALTVNEGCPGSHLEMWRKATESFLFELSFHEQGICYVLLGDQAKKFKDEINLRYNVVFTDNAPEYYLENNPDYVYPFFAGVDMFLKFKYNEKIDWVSYE